MYDTERYACDFEYRIRLSRKKNVVLPTSDSTNIFDYLRRGLLILWLESRLRLVIDEDIPSGIPHLWCTCAAAVTLGLRLAQNFQLQVFYMPSRAAPQSV